MRNKKLISVVIFLAVALIFCAGISVATSSSDSVDFFTMGSDQAPYCLNVGNDYADNPAWAGSDFTDSINDCYRENGVGDSGPQQFCCPLYGNTTCVNGGSEYSCVAGPESCEELDEAQCGDANYNILSENEANQMLDGRSANHCGFSDSYGNNCSENVGCGCVWVDGECRVSIGDNIWTLDLSSQFDFHDGSYYSGGNSYDASTIQGICQADGLPGGGECVYDTSTINNCNTTGLKYLGWTVDWTGSSNSPDWCQNDSKEVSCISNELSFVANISIVIFIVLIIVFYLYVIRKKKKIKKKRK